jgi:hypothetical protein
MSERSDRREFDAGSNFQFFIRILRCDPWLWTLLACTGALCSTWKPD